MMGALTMKPRLLLDEPVAGMNDVEAASLGYARAVPFPDPPDVNCRPIPCLTVFRSGPPGVLPQTLGRFCASDEVTSMGSIPTTLLGNRLRSS